MKALILLTGIALFSSGFMSNEFTNSAPAVVKAKPSNQHFNYFRAHRMANDASLNWSVANPMEAVSFTIMFSYDGEYWYEQESVSATGAAVYRKRVKADPGTTHFKIIAMQKDFSTVESAIETVKIVKRG
jgi:hypothetical protein